MAVLTSSMYRSKVPLATRRPAAAVRPCLVTGPRVTIAQPAHSTAPALTRLQHHGYTASPKWQRGTFAAPLAAAAPAASAPEGAAVWSVEDSNSRFVISPRKSTAPTFLLGVTASFGQAMQRIAHMLGGFAEPAANLLEAFVLIVNARLQSRLLQLISHQLEVSVAQLDSTPLTGAAASSAIASSQERFSSEVANTLELPPPVFHAAGPTTTTTTTTTITDETAEIDTATAAEAAAAAAAADVRELLSTYLASTPQHCLDISSPALARDQVAVALIARDASALARHAHLARQLLKPTVTKAGLLLMRDQAGPAPAPTSLRPQRGVCASGDADGTDALRFYVGLPAVYTGHVEGSKWELLESDADLLLLIKTVNRVHVVDCAKVPNPDRELNRHMYSMARYGTWFMGTDPNPYGDVGDILDI